MRCFVASSKKLQHQLSWEWKKDMKFTGCIQTFDWCMLVALCQFPRYGTSKSIILFIFIFPCPCSLARLKKSKTSCWRPGGRMLNVSVYLPALGLHYLWADTILLLCSKLTTQAWFQWFLRTTKTAVWICNCLFSHKQDKNKNVFSLNAYFVSYLFFFFAVFLQL